MKYMSILLSKQVESPRHGPKLDGSLIERDPQHINEEVQPAMYWYNFGYRETERDKVLVEWKEYGTSWKKDLESKKFEEIGEIMFSRIQGLVAMLSQSKPVNFRVLKCLGSFHDTRQHKFGIVYQFPSNQSVPVRLHYLLRKRNSPAISSPHIGVKLALAKALARSLQYFHISGWVHKDINSHNILFFTSSSEVQDADVSQPYVVGFDHSREHTERTYTERSSMFKKYLHPKYQMGLTPFKKQYDYHSFGILLLEIGAWESLSNIYSKHVTETAFELKQRYIKICDKVILERMGPTYHEATRTCLLADSNISGEELDSAVDFQRDVIDRLSSCRL